MAHKLYEKQSYCKEYDTLVKDSFEKAGKYFAVLEETIFFPEEGGQYADTGILRTEDGREIRVLDGKLDGEQVVHEVSEAIEVGTKVHCVLDWDKRYMRMQNHSGEHILTGAIHNRYGYDNVGFHLSDDGEVTMDMSGVVTWDELMEMETLANQLIYANLPILDLYPTKEELKEIDYRSKIEIDGQVRIIQIGQEEPHDLCACCAPHVATTGEVGIIKVTSLTNYKGGVRIGILCGLRGLLYAREQSDLLSKVAGMLSTKPEQVFSIVENMREEVAALKQKVTELTDEKVLRQIEELQDEKIIFLPEDVSAVTMKNAFNVMAERFSGYTGVFVGNDENGYRYYAGSRDLDAKELAQVMRERLGAKGGGNSEMIQGKVENTKEEIRGVFECMM